jgi:hypothetical protein
MKLVTTPYSFRSSFCKRKDYSVWKKTNFAYTNFYGTDRNTKKHPKSKINSDFFNGFCGPLCAGRLKKLFKKSPVFCADAVNFHSISVLQAHQKTEFKAKSSRVRIKYKLLKNKYHSFAHSNTM